MSNSLKNIQTSILGTPKFSSPLLTSPLSNNKNSINP